MKTFFLCLGLSAAAFGQESSDLFDKAPPAIDEALRARVTEFYQLYEAGKFKQAFTMVADDSQDAFFGSGKEDLKSCSTAKINYSDNFTRAAVVETCKMNWAVHGESVTSSVPITTNWKVVDGQWYWSYVKPTAVRSPFSPTGSIPLPADAPAGASPSMLPKDPAAEARNILGQVTIDKDTVTLRADQGSKDQVQVKNDMPGTVSLSLDPSPLPGLKITSKKTDISQHEVGVVEFEYNPDNNDIACSDCAKRVEGGVTFTIHIMPTNQAFPVTIKLTDQKHQQYELPKQ